MKAFIASLLFFLCCSNSSAQVFKKLADKLKGDAEWRVRSKVDQQVSKGRDTVIAAPKKLKDKKKEKST